MKRMAFWLAVATLAGVVIMQGRTSPQPSESSSNAWSRPRNVEVVKGVSPELDQTVLDG